MKAKILACKTMEDEILALKPPEIDCEFMEYALHRVPDKLTRALQDKLDAEAESDYDTILLGYGLCSNGVVGLVSPKQKLVIPRAHDCISLLLGSKVRYSEEFNSEPGTIYLTKGWIVNGADPLSEYERYTEQYGSETAQWVMDEQYRNYTRVLYIDTGIPEQEQWRTHARNVAGYLKVKFSETGGGDTYLRKLIRGDWDEDFVIVLPGTPVQSSLFL
jgi:hypothetical protein